MEKEKIKVFFFQYRKRTTYSILLMLSTKISITTGSTICLETLYFVDCEPADGRSENFRLK